MTTTWRIVGFLCETTLTDLDKRTSLIGIMPGRLATPGFPMALTLGAFVRINPLPPKDTPVKITISLDDRDIANVETISIESPPDAANMFGLDSLHVNIGRIGVMVPEPSTMKMLVSVGGSEPELVSVLRIELAEPEAAKV